MVLLALQATVRPTETTLIADAANKEEIDMRVQQIKQELAETESTYDTEKLSERIAKLAGGVAVIKVTLPLPFPPPTPLVSYFWISAECSWMPHLISSHPMPSSHAEFYCSRDSAH